ncbi:hypothetical protein E2562_004063 [Oryza meyeriana var. granulata]|uniref:Uncharacterized protein n=1 Tax=Oryza meyeriana var. granulata TaxID=110450 RepID=A0A6G1BKB0_9ORYZ|nr:hypothetical protein E2562_004063 [Oryza meyeriana var. granulata]
MPRQRGSFLASVRSLELDDGIIVRFGWFVVLSLPLFPDSRSPELSLSSPSKFAEEIVPEDVACSGSVYMHITMPKPEQIRRGTHACARGARSSSPARLH